MARLLVVHHTASPALHEMFDAVISGATNEEITDVEVVRLPALSATASDVLAADGYVLGTPANIGYMSGALKHFFDQIYYPCLDGTQKRPYGVYIHGNLDTTGAFKAIESIVGGLKWEQAAAPVVVLGKPEKKDLEACWDLGATLAATLMPS